MNLHVLIEVLQYFELQLKYLIFVIIQNCYIAAESFYFRYILTWLWHNFIDELHVYYIPYLLKQT